MPKRRPGRAQWFKIRLHDKALIDAIPSQNLGDALKAGMAYFADGEMSVLDPLTQAMFSVLKSAIDEASAAYKKAVADGSKGGRPTEKEGNPPLPEVTHHAPRVTDIDIRDIGGHDPPQPLSCAADMPKPEQTKLVYDPTWMDEVDNAR